MYAYKKVHMATTILRFEKIKHKANIRSAGAHQHRHHKDTPNANSEMSGNNVILVGTSNVLRDAEKRLSDLSKEPRKNAVLAMDGMMSLSPEMFKKEDGSVDNQNLEKFADRADEWLKERFGDNLVNSILHLDESTPHIHFTVVPLDEKPSGRKVLNARDLFGKEQLHELQKEFYAVMHKVLPELEPPKHGSKAKHVKIKEFYAKLDEMTDGLEQELKLFSEDLKENMTKTVMKKLAPMIERQFEDLEKHIGAPIEQELRNKLKYEQERKLEGCLQFAINESKTLQNQEEKILKAINEEKERIKNPEVKPRFKPR